MDKKLKLGLEISKVNHIISRKMDEEVMKAIDGKITISQAYVIDLIYMKGQESEIFQKDIEKEFDLKRSSVSLMLSNMEKEGLITREEVKEDGRLRRISLTPYAITLYDKISVAIDKIENKISDSLTEEEIKSFKNIIKKIRDQLE